MNLKWFNEDFQIWEKSAGSLESVNKYNFHWQEKDFMLEFLPTQDWPKKTNGITW